MKNISLFVLILTLFQFLEGSDCSHNKDYRAFLENTKDVSLANLSGLSVAELQDRFYINLELGNQAAFEALVNAIIGIGGDIDAPFLNSNLLKISIISGNLTAVQVLFHHGSADLNVVNNYGRSALYCAVNLRRFDIAEFLVDNGANVSFHEDLLIVAVKQSCPVGLLEKLVAGGLQVNFLDTEDDGVTALTCACENGNVELFQSLLDFGAEVNLGPSALSAAAKNGHAEIVKELLERGADFNYVDSDGNTPLHSAVNNVNNNGQDNSKVVRNLLESGAFVDVQNDFGQTPLLLAAQFGAHPNVIETLIIYGADVNIPDDIGRTPLMRAIMSINDLTETAHRLLLSSPEIHNVDNCGMSALHLAAKNGKAEVLAYLLGHGVEIDSVNTAGLTPLMLAVGGGNRKAVDYLLSAGARRNKQNFR